MGFFVFPVLNTYLFYSYTTLNVNTSDTSYCPVYIIIIISNVFIIIINVINNYTLTFTISVPLIVWLHYRLHIKL